MSGWGTEGQRDKLFLALEPSMGPHKHEFLFFFPNIVLLLLQVLWVLLLAQCCRKAVLRGWHVCCPGTCVIAP